MFDIHYASIREIHDLFREQKLTVREIVLQCLSRIAEVDKGKNGVNSVLEVNPDVLFIADSLDNLLEEKLKNGEPLSPLFGIPVLLKDNINTHDRLHTSAGSVALADNYAPYDAHVVKVLRDSGAVILGKANMTEFANYMSREGMPSGYSSRGGQVINPLNRDKTPSGSSSGSAVAVAAGICPISVGTETCGSILSPAGQNGIVGIKPTLGLVGRSGIVPISSTHDTAGPMAGNVYDAAVLLGVLAGYDPDDVSTHAHHVNNPIDYTKYLDPNGMNGMRIGINRSQKLDDFILSSEEKAIFDHLCQTLSDAGAILIDNINMDSSFSIGKIMRNEFKSCMNSYLSTLGGSSKMKSLKDIIQYNQANPEIALKYGQSLLTDCQNNTSGTMTEPEYIEALLERESAIHELDRLFDENNIDVMLCETFTSIAPFTGFPSMTIPTGQRKDKIKTDSHWIARRFDEASLLKAAYAAEILLNVDIKPDFSNLITIE